MRERLHKRRVSGTKNRGHYDFHVEGATGRSGPHSISFFGAYKDDLRALRPGRIGHYWPCNTLNPAHNYQRI